MGKGRASLRPLSAALALVTGGNEQTEAGKEGGGVLQIVGVWVLIRTQYLLAAAPAGCTSS